jgi:hypothetical protein
MERLELEVWDSILKERRDLASKDSEARLLRRKKMISAFKKAWDSVVQDTWDLVSKDSETRLLEKEMISAFKKAEPSAQAEFLRTLPEILKHTPRLVDPAFKIIIDVIQGDHPYPCGMSLISAAVKALPACISIKPDLMTKVPQEEIVERAWWGEGSSERAVLKHINQIYADHVAKERNKDLQAVRAKIAKIEEDGHRPKYGGGATG